MSQEARDSKKYKMLTDVEHIMLRSEMWVGSKKLQSKEFAVIKDETFEFREIEYVPAILKLIDEIISNSVDEFRRKTSALNHIKISVTSKGHVVIHDNGGIPVQFHDDYKMYIPELLFGNLRTSSNYDDSQNRTWVGTNGVGAVLTNIFSKSFIVETGFKGNRFMMEWRDNMSKKSKPKLITDGTSKWKGTRIEFDLDLSQFGIDQISQDFMLVIQKRCIDAAAINPGLWINFELPEIGFKKTYKFDSFSDYVKMYGVDGKILMGEKNKDWEFYITPTDDKSMKIGFVNGAQCDKGVHVTYIEGKIHQILEQYFKKTYKWKELPRKEVINRINVFININVKNPSYKSQTKEELDTRIDKFFDDGHHPVIDEKQLFKVITASELPNLILDWNNRKNEADELKKLRLANKEFKNVRIDKLIEANSKNRDNCELWLFEGESASSGFRAARNPELQASYRLRGKIMNTLDLKNTEILKNQEIKDIIAASGLKLGDDENTDNLRYGKWIICTDMDADGNHIAGLLTTFFITHFRVLIEQGRLYRALSPLLIASKGKNIRHYYSYAEYEADKKNLNGYYIKYIKGLAGLEKEDYKQMMRNPRLQRFIIDDNAIISTNIWFGKKSTLRKNILEIINN